MNNLINDIFGDKSITVDCESGECLHKAQVPGYTVPEKKDNSLLVALSAALAAAIFLLACLREYHFTHSASEPRLMGLSTVVPWPCTQAP